jgi:PadR family transcriptional regulator PadR
MVIVFCLCALWVWSWWRARKETTAALIDALVHGPGYGLDLIERVNKQTQGRLVLGQGSVYPHLRELEREGLLESYEGEPLPQRGGRPRRYYKLTAKGVAAVRP